MHIYLGNMVSNLREQKKLHDNNIIQQKLIFTVQTNRGKSQLKTVLDQNMVKCPSICCTQSDHRAGEIASKS